MERKAFLQSLGMGAGSLILSCCLGGCSKSGNNDDDNGPAPNPGTKLDFTFDTTTDANLGTRGWTVRSGVIIAKSGNDYLAFEGSCPHQGSVMTYNGASNTFPCSNTSAGHGSVFDGTGKKMDGPATRDLKKYQTQLSGNSLRVFE